MIKKVLRMYYRKIKQKYYRTKFNKEYKANKRSSNVFLNNQEYGLFITNDRGGGTRHYENIYINNFSNILVLRRVGEQLDLDRYFRIESVSSNDTVLLEIKEVVEFFHQYKFKEIIVNNLNDYEHYETILNCVQEYKKQNRDCIVRCFVHDFNPICLNCNLFVNGRYCNLECEKYECMLKLKKKEIQITEWRKNWLGFLMLADEVRCFSKSSKEIFLNAYPELQQDKISVIPHDMSYFSYAPLQNVEDLELHIGFVGVTHADMKGKKVVKEILKTYGNRCRITLLGTSWWRFNVFRKKIKYLGSYKREEIRGIFDREKISLVVFPSLWPETFSYVVSEVIQLNVPIICFNLGAQAEKVSNYQKGMVCNNIEELYCVLDGLIVRDKERLY